MIAVPSLVSSTFLVILSSCLTLLFPVCGQALSSVFEELVLVSLIIPSAFFTALFAVGGLVITLPFFLLVTVTSLPFLLLVASPLRRADHSARVFWQPLFCGRCLKLHNTKGHHKDVSKTNARSTTRTTRPNVQQTSLVLIAGVSFKDCSASLSMRPKPLAANLAARINLRYVKHGANVRIVVNSCA